MTFALWQKHAKDHLLAWIALAVTEQVGHMPHDKKVLYQHKQTTWVAHV